MRARHVLWRRQRAETEPDEKTSDLDEFTRMLGKAYEEDAFTRIYYLEEGKISAFVEARNG